MYIELTPAQRQLQAEIRQYFSNLVTSDEVEEMEKDRHGGAYRSIIRRMGKDGMLGVGWPKEFGGRGFGGIEQQIFVNEAHRADVPLPAVTLQTVGPTLQMFGTELQKQKFLPGILAGEIHFAIGYSEPDAGTDLAALRTTAVRQGDEYIVNGQKMWTTGGHDADYVWLACRTDPTAAKHKGISILIVDTTDPGFSWTPFMLSDGVTPIDHDDVQRALGEIYAMWRINELLNWQVAAAGDDVNVADAAATKVFGTERIQRIGRLAEEIVFKYGNPAEPNTAELIDWLDSQTKRNLVITFGGGVNEVMREMIAASGLKVPRVPR